MLRKIFALFKAAPEEKQPRAARVQVVPFHDIMFQPRQTSDSSQILKIANISTTGLGIIPPEGKMLSPKGTLIEGSVIFPSARFPVAVRVAYSSAVAWGCAFTGEYTSLANEILRYFNIEIAARELVEVNPEILKKEPDGAARLLRGRNNCEVFLVEHEGKIVRFQISFFGNYIEGGEGLKTKLGFLTSAQSDKPKYKGATIVRIVSELSPDVLRSALKFIEDIPLLTIEQREIICIALRHGA